jgi:F0F1-type ATP synthase beta subunit
MSALLGRILGGRLPADAGDRHGRAAGAHHHHQGLDHLGAGDLRAGRRSDRSGAATLFTHLDATTVLSRSIAERHYPAVDPLDSTRACLADDRRRGRAAVTRQVQRVLQRYKALQDIIAILGMDELSGMTASDCARARSSAFCRNRSRRGGVHRPPGVFVQLEDTIRG